MSVPGALQFALHHGVAGLLFEGVAIYREENGGEQNQRDDLFGTKVDLLDLEERVIDKVEKRPVREAASQCAAGLLTLPDRRHRAVPSTRECEYALRRTEEWKRLRE
jgi:hypothetical protein